MNLGKIIEYIDEGKFVCTLCLQDKGTRLHLLTPLNREVNISPKRAILFSKSIIDSGGSRETLLNRLKEIEALRKRLKREVHVKDLWELVRDGQESFEYSDLAQLCFGEKITDDHISALVRALFDDRLYFKMKEGRFLPHSEEMVEQIIKQREEEARRETRLKEGSSWLRNHIQNKVSQAPSCKDAVIDLLIELALYGKEAPNFSHTKDLLLRAGITDVQRARSLLVDLGVWGEDENLDLYRLNVNTSFSEAVLNASERLTKVAVEEGEREDLRDLNTFTIDGPDTKDFDDALSIEITSDSILLGIHIADVASAIPPDSLLDKEASQRGSSLYLPRRSIHMIPPNLSQNTLSLRKYCDRPAISLLCRFDNDFSLLDYRFVPSVVRVQENLTYDTVNENLDSERMFREMHKISHRLRENRNKEGALGLSLPELQIKVNADSALAIELVPQNTPSRMIVAELMILYNWLAARFCRDEQIPALFRSQSEPSERLSIDDSGYLYYVFKQRRKLRPLVIDTSPKPHSGLGLDAYTQVTSPIRRYLDIVMQRQIGNVLMKRGPFYDEKGLDEIRISVETQLKESGRINRNRIRYWVLKFLRQHRGESFPALVLDELKSKYRILLKDFLLIADLKREPRVALHPADQIRVQVKNADPWQDTLELAYA